MLQAARWGCRAFWKGCSCYRTDPGVTGPSVTVDSLPATRELELWLSMPEFGEKELFIRKLYRFGVMAECRR